MKKSVIPIPATSDTDEDEFSRVRFIPDDSYSDSEAMARRQGLKSHADWGKLLRNNNYTKLGYTRLDEHDENVTDEENDPEFMLDEFGNYLKPLSVSKLVKTGRQRKKSAARTKGGEFQARRRKKRIYFCCLSSEIDIQKLNDHLSTHTQLKGWYSKMYSDVLHLHKYGNPNDLFTPRINLHTSSPPLPSNGPPLTTYPTLESHTTTNNSHKNTEILETHKNHTTMNTSSGINAYEVDSYQNPTIYESKTIDIQTGSSLTSVEQYMSTHNMSSKKNKTATTTTSSTTTISPIITPLLDYLNTTSIITIDSSGRRVESNPSSPPAMTSQYYAVRNATNTTTQEDKSADSKSTNTHKPFDYINTSHNDTTTNTTNANMTNIQQYTTSEKSPVSPIHIEYPPLYPSSSTIIHHAANGYPYDNESMKKRHEEIQEELQTRISTPGAQEVFIFDFGAVVFWGYSRGDEMQLLKIIRMFVTKGNVGSDEFHSGEDDMAYVTIPDTDIITIANDVLTIPDDTPAKQRLSISFAIAQSAVLAIFESRIDRKIVEYKYIPEHMATHGRIHLSERKLGTMIGEVFVIRHDVNLHTEILDIPDFFWKDGEKYENDYKLIMRYLEMGARTEVLNKRLDMLRELLDVLQQQMENDHGVKLEWIVIWLIVVEVVLQLIAICVDSLPNRGIL